MDPDARTIALFQQIAGDTLGPTFSQFDEGQAHRDEVTGAAHLIDEFRSLRARLAAIEGRIGIVLAGLPDQSGSDAAQTPAETPLPYAVVMPG